MNTLEQIHEMWKKDCLIDKMDLDKSARDSAKLHSKYLELYSVNKLKYKKLDNDFKVLLKNKWLHYNGKLSKEEIDEFGWNTQELIDTLKEILENIKWRHQNIKNIIEWNKFTSGM